jgi:hypothetical protein
MERHLKQCLIRRRKDKVAALAGKTVEPIVPPILPRGTKKEKKK